MSDQFILLDGDAIFLRDTGPTHATPVLLLHSLFFDGTMFDALCRRIGPDFRLVRPDFRGQGRSLPTKQPPTIDRLALDVITIVERLNAGQAHVVGSSMGAYVLMRVLALRPDLVDSAALLCCTADEERDPSRFLGLVERLRQETPARMTEVIARTMFGASFLSDPARETQRQHCLEQFSLLPVSVADAAYHVFTRASNAAALAAYKRPLLLIGGGQDNAKPAEAMRRIRELVPGSRLQIIPDSGHTPAVETPEILADALLAWWSDATFAPSSSSSMEAQ